jgi:glycosyltransferase involved in cell wall biosynthesis
MKVMQLAGAIGSVGGIEIFVHRLTSDLADQSIETVIVTGGSPKDVASLPVVEIRNFVGDGKTAEGERAVVSFARSYCPDVILSHTTANARLLLELNTVAPTVEFLHVFLCSGSKLFRRQNRICRHPIGSRCLLDWYAGPCGSNKSPAIALRRHRQALTHRDALLTLPASLVLSSFMRDYLIGEGVAAERIFVVSNVGESSIKPDIKSKRNPRQLLIVGRVVYNKGYQYALEAMTRLDPDYRLTIIGDGYYLPKLKALADRLGISDRVEFTGFLTGSALQDRRRAASIAVVPSIWPEPAGLVVPEACEAGLKVVAFPVGGIPEWGSRYGYRGIHLAKEVSAEALAEAISDAANDTLGPVLSAPKDDCETVAEVLRRIRRST